MSLLTRTSTTAALAALTIGLATASTAPAQTLLNVDIDDREMAGRDNTDTGNTVSGFSQFTLSGTIPASGNATAVTTPTARTIGAYTVTIAPFDDLQDENSVTAGVQNTAGAIDDRDRGTPTDSGSLTFAQLYDDLIFAGTSTGPTGGMDLLISGGSLQPNTVYQVSFYSFDSGSTPAPQPRTANWLDGNNANGLITATSFSAATLPTTNDQYKFTGFATTDANGALLLLGRNTTPNATSGGVSVGVILNGFEVAVPEPATATLFAAAGALTLALGRRRRPA